MRTLSSFQKGLRVIEVIASKKRGVKVSDLAKALEMPSSNIILFLNTLMVNGYVLKDHLNSRYFLSQKFIQLTENINRNVYEDIITLSCGEMDKIAKKYNENVLLSVLNHTQLKVIHEIHSTQNIQIMNNEEGIFIPHVTALGKAILATYTEKELEKYINFITFPKYTDKTIVSADKLLKEIETIKKQEYSINCGEYDESIYAVAAPIKLNKGLTIAICVQYPSFRHNEEKLKSYGEELKKSAKRIKDLISRSY
jgi:DNA-binding IclR family transcriptional regulator